MDVAPTLAPHKKQPGACKLWTRDALEELGEKYPEIEGVTPMVATQLEAGTGWGFGMTNHYWLVGEKDGKVVVLDGTAGQVYSGLAWDYGRRDPKSDEVVRFEQLAKKYRDGFFGFLDNAPPELKMIYTFETATRTNKTCPG